MDEIEKLKSENEKLRNENENKSELISISAHQIRTSLSALKWTLKMFLDKDFGDITDKQKDYIEKLISSNDRAIVLINYLLTFNHSDDTSVAFNFKQVNILNTLEKVISDFSGEIKNKKINLILEKPETVIPNINCDEEMAIVVLQNLIENAIKYSNDNGEVKISLKHDPEDMNNIEISVHDNGIGINKDDQVKIFSKFFRAPNAMEKDSMGSGLGLFTTKSITERHNGKIWFESSKDSGTTFFVILPMS